MRVVKANTAMGLSQTQGAEGRSLEPLLRDWLFAQQRGGAARERDREREGGQGESSRMEAVLLLQDRECLLFMSSDNSTSVGSAAEAEEDEAAER